MAFEIPVYKFRPEVPHESQREIVQSFNRFLETAPGFIRRDTYFDPKQLVWVDVVEWQTMDLALAAAEDFAKSQQFQAWIAAADPDFGHMLHCHPIQSVTAGQAAE